MLNIEKVLEIFQDYLAEDKDIEVVTTSRGIMRIEWAENSPYCADGYLCRTPEELFEVLLSDCQTHEELKLTKGRRELTPADEEAVQAILQTYWKKREMEEMR